MNMQGIYYDTMSDKFIERHVQNNAMDEVYTFWTDLKGQEIDSPECFIGLRYIGLRHVFEQEILKSKLINILKESEVK